MARGAWSPAELGLLSDMSLSLADVAESTGRTLGSVYHKSARLGLCRRSCSEMRAGRGQPKVRNGRPGWQAWELDLLADPEVPLVEVARRTGRTSIAVRHKASALGLTGIRDYWLRGADHPLWTGGQSPSERTWRGEHWPEVRRHVMERDGFVCQDGGEFRPSGTGLVVHHMIPYRLRPVNDPRWLVTLCVTHHLKRPEHWWREIPADVRLALAEGGDAM